MSRRFTVLVANNAYTTEGIAGTVTTGPTIYDQANFTEVDWLEPKFLSIACNGEIGQVEFFAARHPEDARSTLPLESKAVRVIDYIHTDADGDPTIVFQGNIVKRHTVYQGTTEQAVYVAYNTADYLLYRQALHGQIRLSYTKEQALFTAGVNVTPVALDSAAPDFHTIDTPLIFNPDGEPNMSDQTFYLDSVTDTKLNIFDSPFRNQQSTAGAFVAKFWTLSKAVKFLLAFNNSKWALDPASWNDAAIDAAFLHNTSPVIDPVISNVNLEGKRLLHALRILLEPYNYIFTCTPTVDRLTATTTGKHAIKFYYKGAGPNKTLDFSARGTNAHSSTANCISLDLLEDVTPVVNTLSGYGERKVFTTLAHTDPPTPSGGNPPVMKLSQGWNTADLVWTFDENDATIVDPFNPTFRKNYCNPYFISALSGPTRKVFGVGRRWVVNLGNIPDAALEDLTTDLNDNASGFNSIDPRRLEKTELYDSNYKNGFLRREDLVVEISTDGGDNWIRCERHWYQVLDDEPGIIFTDPNLEKLGIRGANSIYSAGRSYWQAMYESDLRIRILCGIKSDERVNGNVFNAGVTKPLATEGVFSNEGYRRFKYNPLINGTITYTDFAPQQAAVDDRQALTDLATQQAAHSDKLMVPGSAAVLMVNVMDWFPGQAITGVTNRGITFASGKYPTIVRVVYDLISRHVHLAFDTHTVKSIVRTDPQSLADNMNQHKYGIAHPTPVAGATQVDQIPWADESKREILRPMGF